MIGSGAPPDRVPTLTEVVRLGDAPAGPAPVAVPPAVEADVVAPGTKPPPITSVLTEEQLVQRVLGDVQRQVDLMLEYRLREILTPILTRATDAVIRETRAELASTLRDVVARAVTQELSRHRSR
ncbi:MAG TPA: hypothetical protein VGM74_19005 [Burkholderiaceae bacterium]|jgi:hypothetical protein